MILDDINAQLKPLYRHLDGTCAWVLEAGGGSFSHFAIPGGARFLALDISFGQLVRNEYTALRVQGDLHELPLPPESVDVVLSFCVLEHLDDPERALAHMHRVLKPGGILVLGCPERTSLKALVTRATPIGIHRAYYRFVVGKRDRGDKHYDAFETTFRPIVSRRRLRRWLEDRGAETVFDRAYDGAAEYGVTNYTWKARLVSAPYYAVGWLGRALTLGRWRATDSDFFLIARKWPAPDAMAARPRKEFANDS